MPRQPSRAELVGAFGDPIDENPTGITQEDLLARLSLVRDLLPGPLHSA